MNARAAPAGVTDLRRHGARGRRRRGRYHGAAGGRQQRRAAHRDSHLGRGQAGQHAAARRHTPPGARGRDSTRRRAPTGGRCAPAAAAPTTAEPEQQSELGQRAAWRERRETATDALQLAAVGLTRRALATVAAGATADAHPAVGGADQLVADLCARRVASRGDLDHPRARPQQQRLHRRDRDRHRARQLLVAETLELPHQQRRALLAREGAHVGHQTREPARRSATAGGSRTRPGAASKPQNPKTPKPPFFIL